MRGTRWRATFAVVARRYPYGVIYTCVGRDVLVLAIAHLHRRPGYWRDRLGEQQ